MSLNVFKNLLGLLLHVFRRLQASKMPQDVSKMAPRWDPRLLHSASQYIPRMTLYLQWPMISKCIHWILEGPMLAPVIRCLTGWEPQKISYELTKAYRHTRAWDSKRRLYDFGRLSKNPWPAPTLVPSLPWMLSG